jgi:hypothetical protein
MFFKQCKQNQPYVHAQNSVCTKLLELNADTGASIQRCTMGANYAHASLGTAYNGNGESDNRYRG